MRRIPIALLVPFLNVLTPFVPLAAAAVGPPNVTAVSGGANPPFVAAVTPPPPPSQRARAELARRRHRLAVRAAIHHVLALNAQRRHLTLPQLRAMWQRVAICEVAGNWSMTGPIFSGIGFRNTSWSAYGGTQFASVAGRATRDQQILVAMRITGGQVPDQFGCSPFGW